MDRTTIEVNLINSNGCSLGTWDQKVVSSDDVTSAVIECLIKNKIVLVEGDTIVISQA